MSAHAYTINGKADESASITRPFTSDEEYQAARRVLAERFASGGYSSSDTPASHLPPPPPGPAPGGYRCDPASTTTTASTLPKPHSCNLPKVRHWWSRLYRGLAEGAKLHCPCGKSYTLAYDSWHSMIRPHWRWSPTIDPDSPPRARDHRTHQPPTHTA